MKLTELIACAPWREAVTYRDTWPHEYVLSERDGQRELLNVIYSRFQDGEGVDCRFFRLTNKYLFVGEFKYWFNSQWDGFDPDDDENVINRARLYRDRRDFVIHGGGNPATPASPRTTLQPRHGRIRCLVVGYSGNAEIILGTTVGACACRPQIRRRRTFMDNVISLEDLFYKRLFNVPDYQRGYAWGREQIADFLDDLEILTPNQFHYTGTVVLHRRADKGELADEGGNTYAHVDIVDGQQRLTTIVLLLDTVQKALQDPAVGAMPLAHGLKSKYIAGTDPNSQPLHKLTLNRDTKDFFRSYILKGDHAFQVSNAAHARLRDAQSQIREYLDQQTKSREATEKNEWLRKFQAKITKRLGFTLFIVDDEAEVGVIFEVMNDRGKPLSDLEKVKNYLLYVGNTLGFANPIADEVNEAWSLIFRQLMEAGLTRPDYEDQLLRVHWLSHYNARKKEWDGAKSIRRRFDLRKYQDKRPDLVKDVRDYVSTLRACVQPFGDAYRPQLQGAFATFSAGPAKAEAANWGTRLQRVGVLATFLPVLLAVRARWPEDAGKYLRVVKLSEAFAFRIYRFLGARSDYGESALYHLAYDIARGDVSFDKAITRFTQELSWRCPDATFHEALSAGGERVQVAYGKRYLRYFLYEYETYLAAAKDTVPKVAWEEVQSTVLKDTIEHVLPQTIKGKECWTERFGTHGNATHASLVHDLGNLTLTKWNDRYSNRCFQDKKGSLEAETTPYCYAKAPFYQEQELAGLEEWGPAQIETRREQLIAWAKVRWAVDFSDIQEPSPEDELTRFEDEEDSDVQEGG